MIFVVRVGGLVHEREAGLAGDGLKLLLWPERNQTNTTFKIITKGVTHCMKLAMQVILNHILCKVSFN